MTDTPEPGAASVAEAISTLEAALEHPPTMFYTQRFTLAEATQTVIAIAKQAVLVPPSSTGAEVERLREAAQHAILQLEYLDEKLPTGTTPNVIWRLKEALAPIAAEPARGDFDAAQFAADQRSDDPQPGDWNDACIHIAEGITRHTVPSDGAIYAAYSGRPAPKPNAGQAAEGVGS